MKPQYLSNTTHQRDRWLISYVDVLTILLIFFLAAAAKSLNVPPPPAVVHKQPVLVAAPRVEAKPLRTNLIRAQERLRDQGLDPKLEPRGLVISLPQVIVFSSGKDAVSTEALPTIAQIADVLRDIPNNVVLIGHADTVPIHNRRFDNNWDLSMARSRKILELLSKRYDIPEQRLSIASYGPYRPTAPNDTADGRASNRRVEFVILNEQDLEGPPAE